MTITNHALVGMTVGLVVKEPLLALPLALISHFALDILPHFGFKTWQERQTHKRLFQSSTLIDLTLASVIAVVTIIYFPWVVLVCVFLAIMPDLMWGYRFVFKENFGKNPPPPENVLERFHKKIQKYEFPKGVYLEMAVAVILVWLISTIEK